MNKSKCKACYTFLLGEYSRVVLLNYWVVLQIECLSFLPPPKFICESPNSQCDGIWRWSLWDRTGSWGLIPHGGIDALRRRDTEMISLSAGWGYSKKTTICNPGREGSPGTGSVGTLTLDFPALRLVRNKCCLSHLVSGNVLCSLSWLKTEVCNSFIRNCQALSTWHFH